MARKLQYHVTVETDEGESKTFGPDDQLPSWAAKKITNPSAWADEDDDASSDDSAEADGSDGSTGGDEDKPKPYLQRTKPALEAEVATRNEGRDDDALIVVGGTGAKKDLAAALEADDEAQAGSGD